MEKYITVVINKDYIYTTTMSRVKHLCGVAVPVGIVRDLLHAVSTARVQVGALTLPARRQEFSVAQGLDQQVGHGVMEVARVDNKDDTHGDRKTEHDLLSESRLVGPARPARIGSHKLSDLIVGAKAETFNERTFNVVIFFTIKEVVHQARCALGAALMECVAHVAIGIVVRANIL
jgi:hypothetical protein